MLRLITAAVLVPALWLAIKVAPPRVFYVVATVAIVGAVWECYRMLARRGARPLVWLGLAASAGVVWAYAESPPLLEPSQPLLALLLVSTISAMWLRPGPEPILETLVNTIFPVVFIGLTMGHVVALRAVPGHDGSDLVTLLFVCVIVGDTAAYYVGTSVGRHKMSPLISPNKSWEGFAGAMVGSVLGALVAHFWFYQRLPLWHVVPLGLILGLTGALGDLAESVFKRACGVKDSSDLIPGHGGIFDRTDNLLLAPPVLYYYYAWFLQGSGA